MSKVSKFKSMENNAEQGETPKVEKGRLRDHKLLIITAIIVFLALFVISYISDQRLHLRERFLWQGEVVQTDTTEEKLIECEKKLTQCENELMDLQFESDQSNTF